MTFAQRLKETREARGLTKLELGKLAGLHASNLTRLEKDQASKGARTRPGAETITKLARALEVSERWLLSGEGSRDARTVTTGAEALERVLDSHEWPVDLDTSVVDGFERLLREEAQREPGAARSVAAWRHRIAQLLRGHGAKRKAALRALTAGR